MRREAARALGSTRLASVVPSLLEALAREGMDRTEEHSLTYALIEVDREHETRRGLTSRNPRVRRCALIAIDQMQSGTLSLEDLRAAIADEDPTIRNIAARTLIRMRTGKAAFQYLAQIAAQHIETALREDSGEGELETGTADLIATFAADDSVASTIGRYLADPASSQSIKLEVLNALSDGTAFPVHPTWVRPLRHFLRSSDTTTMDHAIAAVSRLEGKEFSNDLSQLAGNTSLAPMTRFKAIQATGGSGSRLSDNAFAILVEMIESGSPRDAAAAAQIVGSTSLSKSQLPQIVPLIGAASPSVLRDLVRPFQRGGDVDTRRELLIAIEASDALFQLPTNEISDAVKRFPAELLPAANRILDRMKEHDRKQLATLDRLRFRHRERRPTSRA